jgi:RNA polymerase sigma factor FliA
VPESQCFIQTSRLPIHTQEERERLILEHLPLIKVLAWRLQHKLPPNVEISDLVSAGIIGFMDALENFDPARGVRLKTFAEFRVRGAMLDSLRELDWAPRNIRTRTKWLERTYRGLEQELGRSPDHEELCAAMEIDLEELHRLVCDLQGLNLNSLDSISACSVACDHEAPAGHFSHRRLEMPLQLAQTSETRGILAAAIDALPKQQRLVMALRYYDELSMQDVAQIMDVNPSRISQLHTKALATLRSRLGGMEIAA